MKLDNSISAYKYRFYFPLLILFGIVPLLFYFLKIEEFVFLPIIGAFFISIYIFFLIRKPHFFYFESNYNNIKIKFYNPHIFFSKYKVIEIPYNHFKGYKITKSFMSLKKSLIFEIKKDKKSGFYPPISISLLKKSDLLKLENELDYILKTTNLK